ncbi:MAG: hypothetical protein M3O09_06065 [Acidobacteriota bacterium]|nr:hypothetical protein [Acidobacteriota bacterium]
MRLAASVILRTEVDGQFTMTPPREKILAEIAALSKQQLFAMEEANFVGWDAEQRAAFSERSERINLLRRQLGDVYYPFNRTG